MTALAQKVLGRFSTRTTPRGCMVARCQREANAMVVCGEHWKHLPRKLSDPVWREYETGWHAGTHPTNGFNDALRRAVEWLEANVEDDRPRRLVGRW